MIDKVLVLSLLSARKIVTSKIDLTTPYSSNIGNNMKDAMIGVCQTHCSILSLANEYPIVYGNRLELFKQNMVHSIYDYYDLNANISDTTAKGDYYGGFKENGYFFDSVNGKQPFNITFNLKNEVIGFDASKTIQNSYTTKIIPCTKKTSPSSNKNILIIGDSWTEWGHWVQEFKRRLIGGTSSEEGYPNGDGLTNISFVGSKTLIYENPKVTKTEGISGKHVGWFLTDAESPFIINGRFDVSGYCSKNNISAIDYIIILLGANFPTNTNDFKNFINYFKAYNPSVKVLVGTNIMNYTTWGAHLESANAQGLLNMGIKSANSNFWKYAEYNNQVRDMCAEMNNVFYVDVPSQVDCINNYGFELVNANNRNSNTKVKQGINNVHPAKEAYLQVADAFYNAFHYYILD